ncbi:MAG: hypothetical protein DRP70_02310 [Spirochaetes bacterium]|nr:MAG: hypothetical protein DRP49_01750 [Spirochaetota bacterium]RKX89940.1 MAG: hypothetical protein DRP70_02310 [Spirochaetota bacterium]RKX98850.1 MAG: hypothetical protein DRZ90_01370 [Spirochaetota bacterium]
MGIKPIDLQTLFVKMGEVGKEQSHIKEQAALQQAQVAKSQVTREMADDRKVTEAPEDTETEKIKDNESEETPEGEKRKKNEKEKDEEDGSNVEIVTDPDVGRHVDLSG